MNGRAFVYKCYDADNKLLYVGYSKSVLNRITQHQYGANWFDRVARIEAVAFESAEDAKLEERRCAENDNPEINISMTSRKRRVRPNATRACLIKADVLIGAIRSTGRSVKAVCEEAGVTRQTFYSVIKPGGNPKMETIMAIARAAGVTPAQIKPELAE